MKKKNVFSYSIPSGNLPRIFLSLSCLLILFLLPLGMNTTTKAQEEQVSLLAPQILRFHILANSDSDEDQSLKLEVRDLLLQKIYADLEPKEAYFSKQEAFSFKQKLQQYIQEHGAELEKTAEAFMKRRGFSYPAQIEVTKYRFPSRDYAGVTVPAGTYDAIRVLLGNADGHNWWCILYPPLSFTGREAIKEETVSTHSACSDNPNITVELHLKSWEWLQKQFQRP